jgi:hypothetical protein
MIKAVDSADGMGWALYHGDNALVMPQLPQSSVHLTVTSIPFASLYCYSNTLNDYSNCRTHAEFFQQFAYWVKEMLRLTKPGRVCCIHLMQLPTSKTRDGYIGIVDFRGAVIRAMTEGGWIYHSEVCVWKDPVVAVQRTKALGLLFKQLRKDSTMSRMGVADYVCMFRRPGENAEAVAHTHASFPVERWQKWASPVWMDIQQGRTLNVRSAREEEDEAHLCALQLDVIERCMVLYSNPGDVIFDPFAGIGSTGYVALQEGRRFVGVELKRSYFEQARRNLASVEPGGKGQQASLFEGSTVEG